MEKLRLKNADVPTGVPTKPTEGSSVTRSEVARIYSRILDTEVWVVPDGWTGELAGPVYSDTEIWELDRLETTPDDLRKIHMVKIELDGDVRCSTESGQGHSGDLDVVSVDPSDWGRR